MDILSGVVQHYHLPPSVTANCTMTTLNTGALETRRLYLNLICGGRNMVGIIGIDTGAFQSIPIVGSSSGPVLPACWAWDEVRQRLVGLGTRTQKAAPQNPP